LISLDALAQYRLMYPTIRITVTQRGRSFG
jgi:hypothetical protein